MDRTWSSSASDAETWEGLEHNTGITEEPPKRTSVLSYKVGCSHVFEGPSDVLNVVCPPKPGHMQMSSWKPRQIGLKRVSEWCAS